MEDRYKACIILHGLGDTIGFKNSEWEFMRASSPDVKIKEKVFEFIEIGGINYVPEKGWRVSDDTILHNMVAKSLLSDFKTLDGFMNILRKNFIKAYDQFKKEGDEVRYPGLTILDSIKKLKSGLKWNELPYNYWSGGSGASMRNCCIGLAYYGKEYRNLLLTFSLEASRLTHNSAIGYLGGMVSALFTAFAIEGIHINKWGLILKDMFDKGVIDNIIKESGREFTQYEIDKHQFIEKWYRYIEDKFDDKGEIIRRRVSKNLFWRSKYYLDNYSHVDERGNLSNFIGSSGDDSVIIAYDCLIDAGKSWEKLVFYSMLHIGDTDTTGCIAAGWYGAIYGFGDVPNKILDNLEMKNKLEKNGSLLFKKYYNSKRE
jgi:ADP-ribosylarginine hydrolase